MANTVFGTVIIQHANEEGDVTRREALAAAGSSITPGLLLERPAATTVQEHSTAGGVLEGKLVAIETQTPDSESALTIDVDYAVGDTVYYVEGKPGDIFYMWLAASQAAVMGTMLVSNGDGMLKLSSPSPPDATVVTNTIVGTPHVPVTTGGAAARIQVRII